MKKYQFGKNQAFAFAFAWHEANENGRRVKVEKAGGAWIVKVADNIKRPLHSTEF